MNSRSLILALILSSGAAFCNQKGNAPPTLRGNSQGSPAPTLGPAPSLNGPLTANIMDARRLQEVKTVYIAMMEEGLSLKLANAFAKAAGPFRVVNKKQEADAILQGTCFDSPRLREVHSEVFLTARNGKAVWQDIIHQPYHPPALSKAVSETASQIVAQLKESIRQAARR